MGTEVSAIARKLQNYYVVENEKPEQPKSGTIKNLLLIGLMSLAVFLTSVTLGLVRIVKRLER